MAGSGSRVLVISFFVHMSPWREQWCFYADIGLDIAVGEELAVEKELSDASQDELQEFKRVFDICTVVPESKLARAYRNKTKSVHPDKNLGNQAEANKSFQFLTSVWGTLEDTTLRRKYDKDTRLKLQVHIHNRCRAHRKLGAPHDDHNMAGGLKGGT